MVYLKEQRHKTWPALADMDRERKQLHAALPDAIWDAERSLWIPVGVPSKEPPESDAAAMAALMRERRSVADALRKKVVHSRMWGSQFTVRATPDDFWAAWPPHVQIKTPLLLSTPYHGRPLTDKQIEDPANVQRELQAAMTPDRKRYWRASTTIGSTAADGEDPMRPVAEHVATTGGLYAPEHFYGPGSDATRPVVSPTSGAVQWSGMEADHLLDPAAGVNYRERWRRTASHLHFEVGFSQWTFRGRVS